MLLVLLSTALADPSRCTASLAVPVPECALRGEYAAIAAGPNEKAADRAARAQLDSVLELAVAAQRARAPASEVARYTGCVDVAHTSAYVSCFAQPELATESFCFVGFDDPDCWDGQVLTVEGVGWRMLAEGRKQMCAAVDTRLVKQAYTDLETRRVTCAASCAAKTKVRCTQ